MIKEMMAPMRTHTHRSPPTPSPRLPPKSSSTWTMLYISAVAFTYACAILLLGDRFWTFYFATDVWHGMNEATDLMSTAIAMFLGAYGALTMATHSIERVRNVQFAIWVSFLLFSFAYGGIVSGTMCVANVFSCAVVLSLLLRQ